MTTTATRLLEDGEDPDSIRYLMPWEERGAFMESIMRDAPPHPDKPGLRAESVRVTSHGFISAEPMMFAHAVAEVTYREPLTTGDGHAL